MKHKFLLPYFIVFALVSCATIEEHESAARIATTYATLKVVNGDAQKAERVIEIATAVQVYAGGEPQVTVDLLIDQINDLINWDRLDNADRVLVQALLLELRARLIERLGPNVLPEDLRVTVDTIATWVIEAAQMA